MSTFEERKKEYLKEVENLIKSGKTITPHDEKSAEIMFNPTNEKELDVAELLLQLLCDSFSLVEGLNFDEIKEIPNEENEGLNTYVKVMNSLKKGEKVSPIIKSISTKMFAKINYGLLVSSLVNSEESTIYIANKTGFDLDNEEDSEEFNSLFTRSKIILEAANFINKSFEECSDADIKKAQEYSNEFHRLCVEGRVDYKTETNKELSMKLTNDNEKKD